MLQPQRRQRPPNRRRSVTFDVHHVGHRFTATISRFGDGRVAEIFLMTAKSGTALEALAHDSAIILSLAFQHGIGVASLAHSIKRDANHVPSSLIGAALDALARIEAEGT